jgi:putative tryptophan/tyrosine transport system substrate-binding protein
LIAHPFRGLAADTQAAKSTGLLILVLAVSVLLATLAAEAQEVGKVYRVGLIFTTSPVSEMAGPEPVHPSARAFMHGLRALGYVEGRNLIVERRSAEGRFERFGDIVAELVRLKTDVIVAPGDVAPRAAKMVTTTIPIVMATAEDPVGAGLIQSLARPGGNVTGLMLVVGPEIEGKRLEIFREALPGVSRVAYLGSKKEKDWEGAWGQSVRTAAQALGVTLVLAEFSDREYADAFAQVTRARAEALFVSPSLSAFADRALVVELATRARVPTMFAYRQQVDLGGLMSYGVNVVDNFRRAASFVDRILKGAKPADLPVERPTKFELVINLKTAKALGLTIPPALLLRADQVIE